jgi:molybdopterin-guanine dinucleotide biosynthesis protein A
MKSDKGLRELGGDPLVGYVISRVSDYVDQVLIVLGSEMQKVAYSKVLSCEIQLVVDLYKIGSPLVGAITGFKHAIGEYALITACDMPFISKLALEMLFDSVEEFDGAVFQWPNDWIEPLLAVYKVKPALEKAQQLYEAGDFRIRRILQNMSNVRMIPIKKLRTIDPDLITLFDADTEKSLSEAENILKKWVKD